MLIVTDDNLCEYKNRKIVNEIGKSCTPTPKQKAKASGLHFWRSMKSIAKLNYYTEKLVKK